MRTTLTIDAQVLAEFKKRAAESHRTISSLIEDALREHLCRARDQAATKPLDFPIVGGGGVAPGVDLTSGAGLADFVDRADGTYERFAAGAVTNETASPRRERAGS
jgi:hypothetical protein